MRRVIVALAVTAGLAGGAATAAAWWIGELLEGRLRATVDVAIAAGYPVTLTSYERGIFTSSAETVIEVPTLPGMDAATSALATSPPRLRVVHAIAHGPGSYGFRLGQMISTPTVEGEIVGTVNQLLGNRRLFRATTEFGFGRLIVVRASSPSIETTLPSASGPPVRLSWSGTVASFALHGPSLVGRIYSPGLLATGGAANVGVGAIALSVDLTRDSGERFWVGTSDFSVASIDASLPAARLRVARLAARSEAAETDGLYRSTGTITADELEVMETKIEKPLLKVAFDRIDSTALTEILEAMGKAAPPDPDDTAAVQAGIQAALQSAQSLVATFIANKPQASVEELSFVSPHGAVRLRGAVRYIGDARLEDFSPASDVEADGELDAPLALVDALLGYVALAQLAAAAGGQPPAAAADPAAIAKAARAQRDDWVAQKFLQIEGERARSRIELRAGRVLFNGHALGTTI